MWVARRSTPEVRLVDWRRTREECSARRTPRSLHFGSRPRARLRLGAFGGWQATKIFALDLEDLAAEMEAVCHDSPDDSREPPRDAGRCFAKAEDVDPSDDAFADSVRHVIRRWPLARERAGADMQATLDRLLSWIGDDEYGMTRGLAVTQLARVAARARPPQTAGSSGTPEG